jgi:phospholipase C
MPAVSFLKAAAYQDGHAGYSSPLDEQHFVVDTINRLQKARTWKHTAVVIAYDDSDGWYDHQMGPIVNQSNDPAWDALTNGTSCGTRTDRVAGGYQDRCGYGPRLPLLVISPYAKANFVDHTTTDQSSILRFIEDNWNTGRIGNFSFDEKAGSLKNLFTTHGKRDHAKLFLDPNTGEPVTP